MISSSLITRTFLVAWRSGAGLRPDIMISELLACGVGGIGPKVYCSIPHKASFSISQPGWLRTVYLGPERRG